MGQADLAPRLSSRIPMCPPVLIDGLREITDNDLCRNTYFVVHGLRYYNTARGLRGGVLDAQYHTTSNQITSGYNDSSFSKPSVSDIGAIDVEVVFRRDNLLRLETQRRRRCRIKIGLCGPLQGRPESALEGRAK